MKQIKPDICIYHDPCDDGFTAAWVVWTKWGSDVDMRPSNYGQPFPNQFIDGKHILIVDMSYPPDILKRMATTAASITVLDHHATAQVDLEEFLDNTHPIIRVEFDMNRSGARMAWNYCFPNRLAPLLVRIVEDRDLWKFTLPETKAVNMYLQTLTKVMSEWNTIADQLEKSPQEIVNIGNVIRRFWDKKVQEVVDMSLVTTVMGHDNVALAHAPHSFASDVGHQMLKKYPDADFAAVAICGKDGMDFSLRSTDDRVDVGKIAKSHGGGGHRNASGFSAWGNST